MSGRRWLGVLLLFAGVLIVVYGGFSYVEESHDVELGPLELEVQEKERVNLPAWLGAIFAAGGVALLALGARR